METIHEKKAAKYARICRRVKHMKIMAKVAIEVYNRTLSSPARQEADERVRALRDLQDTAKALFDLADVGDLPEKSIDVDPDETEQNELVPIIDGSTPSAPIRGYAPRPPGYARPPQFLLSDGESDEDSDEDLDSDEALLLCRSLT